MTKRANRAKSAGAKPSVKKSGKSQYRVRNWSAYNASLVQRGSITFWIDQNVIDAWRPATDEPRARGGQKQYSDVAIEALLMTRSVFHLGLRATQGFAQSVFELLDVELSVPNYSTLSRRGQSLQVALPTRADGPVHVVLDSTGLKVYGEGEWKVRQHGYSKRRTWRKLHLAIDEATGEIQMALLSEASLDDAAAACELLPHIRQPIEQLSADGSYDKRKVYETCEAQQVERVCIPPRKDAHIWQHGNCAAPPLARDENLRRIRAVGRTQWKQETGYHRRSLAETSMFRFKTIFGPHLRARTFRNQQTEALVKCAALNRMTHLGRPISERVA